MEDLFIMVSAPHTGQLAQQKFLSPQFWKSEIEVSAWLASPEASFLLM
jgi:hypothetical protein